jgi:gluconokinase
MIVLLMGVAGVGKTAVGQGLAARLGCAFVDGDDLHPEANRRKMAAGQPLDDDDRWPWLRAIRAAIDAREAAGEDTIFACSALKESYRRLLVEGTRDVRLVHLRGGAGLIAERLRARRGHFFDPRLLPSQLATLEVPEGALAVEVDAPLEEVVQRVIDGLGAAPRQGDAG